MAITLFGGRLTLGTTQGQSSNAAVPDPDQRPFDPRRDAEEVGRTGTEFYSGFLNAEEYNPDLQGLNAIKVYDKMAADGTVKAMLRSINLPIRGAVPKVDAASEDARDVHIAKAVEAGLLRMQGMLWDDLVRQLYGGGVKYGHAVFENVWVKPDGSPNLVDCDGETVLMPYKLAPRLQKSIYQWDIDTYGELKGINQRTWIADRDPMTVLREGQYAQLISTSGQWGYVYIRSERLSVLSIDREGANYLGESVLRSAYKHWYYKDNLLRIMALAFERHGVGVPFAIVKQGITAAENTAIAAALRTLHAHEKGYLIASEAQLADGSRLGGMKAIGFLDMPTLGTSARALIEGANYHDRQMVLSILADFLSLGSGIGGNANIMHRDKSSLFYNSLRTIVQTGEAVIQGLIKQIVDLNWAGVKEYPTFRMTSLETKDFDRLGRSLALLAQAGLLTPDPGVEAELRDMLDLPPLPMDADGDPMYPPDGRLPPQEDLAGINRPDRPGVDPSSPQGQLLAAFAREYLNDADVKYLSGGRRLHRYVAGADIKPGPVVLGADGKIRNYSAPSQDRATASAMVDGAGNRLREIALQLAHEDGYDLADFLADFVARLRDDALAAYLHAAMNRTGHLRKYGLSDASADGAAWVDDAVNAQRPYIENLARDIETGQMDDADIERRAEQYAGVVWTASQRGDVAAAPDGGTIIWHAEGDAATCDRCAELDGQEFTEDTLPGFPGEGGFGDICDGGINCRCWLEWVDAAEKTTETTEGDA